MSELLEIREADGAFARIEEWLAGHGFFGQDSHDPLDGTAAKRGGVVVKKLGG